ncbi:5-methylcytosine-specific restriction enzyme subunit McrC [Paraburkholderia tropica]
MSLPTRMTKPEIKIVKEYEAVEVDASLFMNGPELLVYPEVLERDYISIRWRKGRPVFFAGGYVGIIPVNDRLVLDVRPKVPLDNLERIIKLSNHVPYELSGLERSYASHGEATAPIEDFLIDSFLDKVDSIHDSGLLKAYRRREADGDFPKGRLNIRRTVSLQAKGARKVAFGWSERNVDTPQNRLIKLALLRAIETDGAARSKRRRARLALHLENLGQVSETSPEETLEHRLVTDLDTLPDTRDYYRPAIALAKLIIRGGGLGFSATGADVFANSLLLDLDVAFEGYVRFVLQDLNVTTPDYRVFDGNVAAEEGRKKALLSRTDFPEQIDRTIDATPDVVIERYAPPRLQSNIVLDMKYKDTKAVADRSDLNQIIAYAASYASVAAVFVFPSRSENQRGLQCLGRIGGIPVYQYFMNLGAANILDEEDRLRAMVDTVFRQRPRAAAPEGIVVRGEAGQAAA